MITTQAAPKNKIASYAKANGYVQSFPAHPEALYGHQKSLEGEDGLARYNHFLDEAKRILKCSRIEVYGKYMLSDKKTSIAARERFWWFCTGLSYCDHFAE